MINEVHQLRKKKVCYIGKIIPRRRAKYAIELASKFFNKENFVPGFPELVWVTAPIYVNPVSKFVKKMDLPFSVSIFTTASIPKRVTPDLLYIESHIVKPNVVEAVLQRFPKTPKILSSNKPSRNGMVIVVDSREQKPLFTGDTFVKEALNVGDYTTSKLKGIFHIERKSPEDLYGTITKGHARFRNELIRAKVRGIRLAMFVECTKKVFVNKEFPGGSQRQISGETLQKIVDTVEKKYGMEIIWCKNRDATVKQVTARLKKEESILSTSIKNNRKKT